MPSIIVLALLVAVSLLTATAHAATVPAKYRGLWCAPLSGAYWYRCRKANNEAYQFVGRHSIKVDEEGDCPIATVKPIARGHRVFLNCPADRAPTPPKYIDLRINARGHLK
jgi:hypothetical protein